MRSESLFIRRGLAHKICPVMACDARTLDNFRHATLHSPSAVGATLSRGNLRGLCVQSAAMPAASSSTQEALAQAPRLTNQGADFDDDPDVKSACEAGRCVVWVFMHHPQIHLNMLDIHVCTQCDCRYYGFVDQEKSAEVIIGRKKASCHRVQTSELLSTLRSRLRNDYFIKPVPAAVAPGYYNKDDPSQTAWNTDVMCLEMMEEKERSNTYMRLALENYGPQRPDMSVAFVQQDLNLIVYNAIIYNPAKHPVNAAAIRLLHSFSSVMDQVAWEQTCCTQCGGDEVWFENPITICDACCAGTHKSCMRDDAVEGGPHPLRQDDASWFCSLKCKGKFDELAAIFCLPERGTLPVEVATKSVAYTAESRVVLARQSKKEDWCFGVTIMPETPEQRRAAAEEPKKFIVLWPLHNANGEVVTTWGMVKSEVKNADEACVAQFLAQASSQSARALMAKNLQWCQEYLMVVPKPRTPFFCIL